MEDLAYRLGMGLLAVLVLVCANGFFVAAEFALVTVRKTRIDQLIAEGSRPARTVRRAISDPESYIAATQLGITMASLALGWIGEPAIASSIQPLFGFIPVTAATVTAHSLATALAFACITALHIVLGELAPKTIALQHAEKTALYVAGPTELFMKIFWPFIASLNGLGRAAVSVLGLKPPSGHSMVHSEEELKMLVTASQEAGVLEEHEEQMLHRVFGFGDLTAGRVMVPRTEMAAVAVDASRQQVIDLVSRAPHPWLPVYRDGLDDIVGILHVTDLFRQLTSDPSEFDLVRLVREALTVPETIKADDLLGEMRRRRTHQAVVIDEYGGTAGLVTFDGLMERIVGEMGSEFGPPSARISVLADGSALIDGLALVTDINEQFGLRIDERIYNTVGGYVLGRLGRRARLGDAMDVEGRTLRVEALDGLRVARVWLSPSIRRTEDESVRSGLNAGQADGVERRG
jgi:CBS domain containing-hemolysin-like protein